MRKIMSLAAALMLFAAAQAQNDGDYEGELSIGGLIYKDNSFGMIETIHGRRFSSSFFLGGGLRTTYHAQSISSEEVRKEVESFGLAGFADARLYIAPGRKVCPYMDLQGGLQGVLEWPGKTDAQNRYYLRPMLAGGIGCVYRRLVVGVYVGVNFESSEGGVKIGLRF